jgi:purine-binding chemotaxis protein CheW
MQLVTFESAGGTHGIPILAVEEFFRPVPITPVPRSDPRVAGLMNLRGKSATVIELRKCFNKPNGEPSPLPKMILLETSDRLTTQARELGVKAFMDPVVLLVDRILDILTIRYQDVQPRPAHVSEKFVSGVFRHDKSYVSLLDLMVLIEDIQQSRG